MTDRRRVMIGGGRFDSFGCALKLSVHKGVSDTLVDRNNYHRFQSLLYQVSTSQRAPSDIAHPPRKCSPRSTTWTSSRPISRGSERTSH